MGGVKSFEELRCWQQSRELVGLVYAACASGALSKDFGTKDQLRRAALSVMNNIAEGFGRDSNREFVRFLDISQSSCMEVKSITYVLDDLKYLSTFDIQAIRDKTDEVKGLTRGLIKHLKSTAP